MRGASLASVSGIALMSAISLTPSSAAFAQTADEQLAQAGAIEELVITGTRVIRDGYEAPTPLTVVGAEVLQNDTATNIAEALNTMPAFGGSISPGTTNTAFSQGTAGLQVLNLRDLGPQRTLVLLDGQRSVGINSTQYVDINLIPQSLVSRVDIITGGASSAYGSDAIAGVVNFVLDKTFTGVKGNVSGGITTYGDNPRWKANLTAGTPFANGRGHFLINGEVLKEEGIPVADRDWNKTGRQFITNPANSAGAAGAPQRLLMDCCVSSTYSITGGIITQGPLKGTAFGPGGTPYQFQYGSLTFDPETYGSPMFEATQARGTITASGLAIRQSAQNVFTRVSYDVADSIQVFAQASWAHNNSTNWCCTVHQLNNMVIRSGNPFIPASVQAQMTALGLTQFTMGSENTDIPRTTGINDRRTTRLVVGGNGTFDAMDSEWNWNAYYQYGISHQTNTGTGTTANALFTEALDAVRGTNGQIMCRSALTNPSTACSPYNPFGSGVASQASMNYVLGNGERVYGMARFTQDVMAASVSGTPLSSWAGPVSLALGIEHRKEATSGINDPISQRFGWFVGNFQVFTAGYNVTEGFAETVVPLAMDETWAEALELTAAVRATSYSTSGYVTTWKVGATWDVIDGVRVRGAQSRDIRAPNLYELFNTGGGGLSSAVNPFLGQQSNTFTISNVGNPNLTPEKSDNSGIGVVLQPSFVPGFSVSVDYWRMKIKDAIGTLSVQQIVDNCYRGDTTFCDAITFDGNRAITFLKNIPFNLITQIAKGLDFEASYQTPLSDIVSDWDGNLGVRFLATKYISLYSDNGVVAPTELAGQNSGGGVPTWRYTGSVMYTNDPFSVTLTARGLSSGTYLNSNIECTTGCPVSTADRRTVNNNHIEGAFYLDTALAYTFLDNADTGSNAEVYLNIRNILNKDPAIVAPGPGGFSYFSSLYNAAFYDHLGRQFTAGVRFKM